MTKNSRVFDTAGETELSSGSFNRAETMENGRVLKKKKQYNVFYV